MKAKTKRAEKGVNMNIRSRTMAQGELAQACVIAIKALLRAVIHRRRNHASRTARGVWNKNNNTENTEKHNETEE